MIDGLKYPACLVPAGVFQRHKVLYCSLCHRQTCHTSMNGGHYRCDNCSRGFCEVPVYGSVVYNEEAYAASLLVGDRL